MITYLTEKEIKDFISNEALDIVTSKRLLNKISLVRIYTYIQKDIVDYFNSTVIFPDPLYDELLTSYVKPITLTLLELTHVQYKGQITNAGLKQVNTTNSEDTIKDTIQEILYKDLSSIKKNMDVFLCDNKEIFTFTLDCGCNKNIVSGGFVAV